MCERKAPTERLNLHTSDLSYVHTSAIKRLFMCLECYASGNVTQDMCDRYYITVCMFTGFHFDIINKSVYLRTWSYQERTSRASTFPRHTCFFFLFEFWIFLEDDIIFKTSEKTHFVLTVNILMITYVIQSTKWPASPRIHSVYVIKLFITRFWALPFKLLSPLSHATK